jgi:uncharacterized protein (TIGR03118 family)
MKHEQIIVGAGSVRKPWLVIAGIAFAFACNKSNVNEKDLRDFKEVVLVANKAEYHPRTLDQTLINGFGVVWTPNGIAWVNSVGGHVSELYDGEGNIKRKPVTIPSPTDRFSGLPCGIVINSSGKGFTLTHGPAAFLFSGFDGALTAWNGAEGDTAKLIKAPANASFTGLAIAQNNGNTFIYAANFGAKKIVVWDTAFKLQQMSFTDPGLPIDYSPYNIQAVGDTLFVMYAKLGTDGHGVAGAGNGFVSIFDAGGRFIKRFASRGTLNVPWGVTLAPGSFLQEEDVNQGGHEGPYSVNASQAQSSRNGKDPVILVGNFGDGRINVFTLDGRFVGQLQSHNQTLVIDGLWALTFPPASAGIDPGRLYFSAGPDHESDGEFGYLIKQ